MADQTTAVLADSDQPDLTEQTGPSAMDDEKWIEAVRTAYPDWQTRTPTVDEVQSVVGGGRSRAVRLRRSACNLPDSPTEKSERKPTPVRRPRREVDRSDRQAIQQIKSEQTESPTLTPDQSRQLIADLHGTEVPTWVPDFVEDMWRTERADLDVLPAAVEVAQAGPDASEVAGPPRAQLWALVVCTAVVAVVTFILSFHGLSDYGSRVAGIKGWQSWLVPVGVDGLTLCAVAATFVLRHAVWRVRAYAWLVFAVAVGASVAGNLSHADQNDLGWQGQIGAAAWPILLAMASHLVIVTRRAIERADRV